MDATGLHFALVCLQLSASFDTLKRAKPTRLQLPLNLHLADLVHAPRKCELIINQHRPFLSSPSVAPAFGLYQLFKKSLANRSNKARIQPIRLRILYPTRVRLPATTSHRLPSECGFSSNNWCNNTAPCLVVPPTEPVTLICSSARECVLKCIANSQLIW